MDDTALNRRIFRLQLEGFGAIVDCAPHGGAALEMLSQAALTSSPFELAVVDQMMPEMDGVTLRNFIRQEPAYNSLKLILSSSGGVDTDEHAIRLGFDAACPKPVTQEKLVRVIHDLLNAESSASADGAESVVAPAAGVEASPETPGSPAADARRGASAESVEAESENGGKPRLLVAEDNAANQRLNHRHGKIRWQGHRSGWHSIYHGKIRPAIFCQLPLSEQHRHELFDNRYDERPGLLERLHRI